MMKVNKILTFVLGLSLFSCQSQKEEVLDFEDVIPSSEHYNEKKEEAPKVEAPTYLSIIPIDSFRFHGIKADSLTPFEDLHFLDRFQHKKSEKTIIWNEGEHTKQWLFTYKDSLQAQNAFINWLNCFGVKCDQISLFSEDYLSKDRITIWQNNHTIIILDRSIISARDQKQWLNTFQEILGFKWNYQLVLQKGKPIQWTTKIDLKENKK